MKIAKRKSMKNFETVKKKSENIQKRMSYIPLHPFFIAGEKTPVRKGSADPERKTKETGRSISLFLLKIGNSSGL